MDPSFSRIPLIYILSWHRKKRRRKKRSLCERSEQPRGWPRDISRLYARPTPNFAELPYDSIYPILPARPPAPSYDSVPPQPPSRYTDLSKKTDPTPSPEGALHEGNNTPRAFELRCLERESLGKSILIGKRLSARARESY